MISLHVVHPFLKNDILNLASHFVSCGYLEGNGVFYVFFEDNKGRTKVVIDEIVATWFETWIFVKCQIWASAIEWCWSSSVLGENVHGLGWKSLGANLVTHYQWRSWPGPILAFLSGDHYLGGQCDIASLVASLHDVNWWVFDLYIFDCLHSINILNSSYYLLFDFIYVGAIKNLMSPPIWSTSCTRSRMSVSSHSCTLRTLYQRMT